jgi:hypothetical protein
VGVPSAAAVAAVLVYRLLTFWGPLVPGLFAFRYLQARRRIQAAKPVWKCCVSSVCGSRRFTLGDWRHVLRRGRQALK